MPTEWGGKVGVALWSGFMRVCCHPAAVRANLTNGCGIWFGWVDVWKSSREVMPRWIFLFDKTNFLFAMPRFDLFFAGYCVPNVAEEFEMYQAEDSIPSGKAWDGSEAVLQDTGVEITGDSGVEAARAAGEDIDGVSARHGKGIGLQRISLMTSDGKIKSRFRSRQKTTTSE